MGKKSSIGRGQPSASYEQEGIEVGRKIYRWGIIESGLRLWREEQLLKEKSVSDVSVLSLSSRIIIISCDNFVSELSGCNNINKFFLLLTG